MSCDLIKLRTTIFNGLLSLLLATLTFCPISVYADSVDRDTLFIDSLKVRFNLDDPVIKSGVIDFYIDSIGVASNDFLKFMAKPMYRLLRRKGVEARLDIYGKKADQEIGHVFHVNCKLPMADRCNDDQCAFFRAHIR